MIFIDPSELRETSNLLRYISDVVYEPLPNLEASTGADLMVSPDGLPFPRTDNLLQLHIDRGAKLIQLKFGHDLPSSIVDERLEDALSRMLKITNERPWQCVLLLILKLGYDDTKGMATIDGQLSYGKHPMSWDRIDQELGFFIDRGGTIDMPLPTGRLIPKRLNNIQSRLNAYSQDKNTKYVWPKAPVFYDEIEPENPHLKRWKVAQKIVIVDDLRPLLCSIPGARIGPERATAIFNYMKENGIREDFLGFMDIVRDSRILEVPGIGKGTREAIQWGLYRTLEERKERNGRKKRKDEKEV